MTTATLPVTETPTKEDLVTSNEQGKSSHMVYVPEDLENGITATAYLLSARINGSEVQALCGYKWVPHRNPQAYPICQKCLELYQSINKDWELPDYG